MKNEMIELNEMELETVVGGNAAEAISTGSAVGAFGGAIAGLGVWGVLAGAALIVSAPVSVPFITAIGAGAAVGAIAGGIASWYYSS